MARACGIFWLVTIVLGILGYLVAPHSYVAKESIAVAGAAYLVVTGLLFVLFESVNRPIALLAALFGVVGVATSADSSLYFGIQCVLVGGLILQSSLLPRAIGVLMVIAGIGQIVVLSNLLPPAVANTIAPAGYITDAIGEIAMALWLTIAGVKEKPSIG